MEATTANPLLFLISVVGVTFAFIVVACLVWAMVSKNGRGAT